MKVRLRNNPDFTDSYLDLVFFENDNLKLFHNVVRHIIKYNADIWNRSESILLIFFEKLMMQVAAATRIQMNFRKYKHNKLENYKRMMYQEPLLIEKVIKKRAIFCIQRFWRNYKLKRRLIGLSDINKIIRKVDSPKIYIELNIYMAIEKIVENIKNRPRFHEQYSSFMFAHDILYVNAHPLFDGILRYPDNFSCPEWFILDLFKLPKFYKPELVNQPLALFHNATMSYGEVVQYRDIVDSHNMEIPLLFLEVHCKNIEEARKRICTLAYLTYDMSK